VSQQGGAPAPAGAVVAVLARRGRFLVAEPLFPRPREAGGPPARRGADRMVVDGSAQGAGRAGDGDLVLVATQGHGRGHARVLRTLGRPDVARDVIEGLMLDRGLRRGFDPAVEREARQAREHVAGAGERRDLRELATFTVDPASARDFDDAVSAERLDAERVRVWVHIADVCAHVPEKGLVDREARRRATSVYVPGAVEPMLPEALSNDACSLVPGQERLAVTVELDLDGPRVTRTAFYRSLIRSDERLDYERVDRIFAGHEPALEPWGLPLAAARQAAAALEDRRRERGALAVESSEPEFAFDEGGHVSEVHSRVQTEAHRLIEHLMIAANEAVATLLSERSVPCLYRVHERPEPERVRRLFDQLATLDVPTPPLPELIAAAQAAELVSEASRMVAAHAQRTGHGRGALGALVLRALKQAYYSPRNAGHAGLSSARYCHFTSPIRRYPDLVCHRALLSAVNGSEPAPRPDVLGELGAWTSERERAAMIIERDADDVASCFALERVLFEQGQEMAFAGEVVGLIGAGAFVSFAADEGNGAPPGAYRGMLPVRRLRAGDRSGGAGWWELNEQGTILASESSARRLRLGDPVAVRVSRVEAARGRADLEPVESAEPGQAPGRWGPAAAHGPERPGGPAGRAAGRPPVRKGSRQGPRRPPGRRSGG